MASNGSRVESYTLKVEVNGEVRRLRGWPEDGSEPSVPSLHAAIGQLFGMSPSDSITMKYRDEDGDLCTLIQVTLADALAVSERQSRVLRVICTVGTASASSSVSGSWSVPMEYDIATSAAPSEVGSEPWQAVADVSELAANPTEATEEVAWSAVPPNATRAGGPRGMVHRLERSMPVIAEGYQNFKQQVIGDYQASNADMKGAFHSRSSPDSLDSPVEHPPVIRKVSNVAATVAGLVAAVRMIPVRGVRFAAESVVAVKASGEEPVVATAAAAPAEDIGDAEHSSEAQPEHAASLIEDATGESAAPQTDPQPEPSPPAPVDQFTHFQNQVVGDFHAARKEMGSAFGCVLGNTEQAVEGTTVEPGRQGIKQWGPQVASTVVGCSVAASLVPLRAVRFAVATTAASRNGAATSGDVVDQCAEDEALARRLHAEWNAESPEEPSTSSSATTPVVDQAHAEGNIARPSTEVAPAQEAAPTTEEAEVEEQWQFAEAAGQHQ